MNMDEAGDTVGLINDEEESVASENSENLGGGMCCKSCYWVVIYQAKLSAYLRVFS
jgi:hypothetical protein